MSLEGEGGTPRPTSILVRGKAPRHRQNPLSALDVPAADPMPPFRQEHWVLNSLRARPYAEMAPRGATLRLRGESGGQRRTCRRLGLVVQHQRPDRLLRRP